MRNGIISKENKKKNNFARRVWKMWNSTTALLSPGALSQTVWYIFSTYFLLNSYLKEKPWLLFFHDIYHIAESHRWNLNHTLAFASRMLWLRHFPNYCEIAIAVFGLSHLIAMKCNLLQYVAICCAVHGQNVQWQPIWTLLALYFSIEGFLPVLNNLPKP